MDKRRGPLTLLRTSRKARWWTGGILTLLAAYPLSLGPVCWLVERDVVRVDTAAQIFGPVIDVTFGQPKWAGQIIEWYASLWSRTGWGWLWIERAVSARLLKLWDQQTPPP